MNAEHDDIRPALGTRGGPASWTPAEPGAPVALARPDFGDAQWSYLYKARDTDYAGAEPAPGQVAAANRRMRGAPVSDIHGPFIHAPAVGLGGRDLLLVRRDGIRVGVRRVRVRHGRRPPLRRDRTQGRARRRRTGAASADRRSRPPGAIPEHDADLQAPLADEHGRVVPGRLQRLECARGRLRPDRAAEGRPRRWARSPRCSAATSAPTPACCSPAARCRCGRAAA